MTENKLNRKRLVLDHSDLELYKIAFQAAMDIFHLSKKWPIE